MIFYFLIFITIIINDPAICYPNECKDELVSLENMRKEIEQDFYQKQDKRLELEQNLIQVSSDFKKIAATSYLRVLLKDEVTQAEILRKELENENNKIREYRERLEDINIELNKKRIEIEKSNIIKYDLYCLELETEYIRPMKVKYIDNYKLYLNPSLDKYNESMNNYIDIFKTITRDFNEDTQKLIVQDANDFLKELSNTIKSLKDIASNLSSILK